MAKSSTSASTAAPTSPAIWLRAPTSSATAVRELLVESGKPWKSPVATFATPSTASSWFWSTSWPSRAGVAARQDARVGERDERDPDRRGDERLEVLERDVGHAERGQAARDAADHRNLVGEAEHGDHRRRADDRERTRPGTCGATRRRTRISASEPTPIASAVAFVSSSPATKSRTAGMKLSASTENPSSWGS